MVVKVATMTLGLVLTALLLNLCVTGVQGCSKDSNCFSGFCFANRKCGCKPGACGFFCQNSGSYCKRKSYYVSNCINGLWMDYARKCDCFDDYGIGFGGRCTVRGGGKCDPPCAGEAVCSQVGPKKYQCICRRPNGVSETGCTEGAVPQNCPAPDQPALGSYFPVSTEYVHPQIITYTCDYGSRIVPPGNRERQCLASGRWDRKVSCELITCPQRTAPANGIYNPMKDAYQIDDIIAFSCDIGYTLDGPSTDRCSADGTWEGTELPVCNRQCMANFPLLNMAYFPRRDYFNVGDVVTFRCNDGYVLVGPATVQCREAGTWTDEAPLCYACPNPVAPANGGFSPRKDVYLVDDVIMYYCDIGFALQGRSADRCLDDAAWENTEPSVCNRQCVVDIPIINGVYSPKRAYYDPGQVVSFTCDEGYRLDGPPTLVCQNSGHWHTDEFPFCVEIYCQEPPIIPNGSFPPNDLYLYGDEVVYECEGGHYIVGKETLVCQSDGNWSPAELPSCKAFCPLRMELAFGSISPSNNGYRSGDIITFSCHGDYMLDGDETDLCLDDGTWQVNEDPVCVQLMNCMVDQYVLNGGYYPIQDSYAPGESVTFQCDDGYCLRGEATFECLDFGEWEQTEYPSCELGCKPPSIDNGGVLNEKPLYCHGEYTKYFCNADYTNSGEAMARCLSGSWSDFAECKPSKMMCARPEVPNGGVDPDQTWYDSRATIRLYCLEGYKLAGNLRSKCSSRGSWNTMPICREVEDQGSCEDRCGKYNYRSHSCQCNFECKYFGTCCVDYDEFCGGYEVADVDGLMA